MSLTNQKAEELDTCIELKKNSYQWRCLGVKMINSFDPSQETLEEYLRRIHLKDNLKLEWNNDQEKEKKFRDLWQQDR